MSSIILPGKPGEQLSIALSVSKVKTFKDCKAKYKFGYIEKLPRKDWEHHIFGKFLHEILENFHQKQIDGDNSPLNVLLTECFKKSSENWKNKISIAQKKESQEILMGYLKKLTIEKSKGEAPTFLKAEKDFYINIDDKILLNGFIDRVQLDPDGVLHVADYKTSKSKTYLKKDLFQLLTYAFVMCLEDPSLTKVRTSYIMLRHNFEAIQQEFTREEIMKVEKIFLQYAEDIEKEKLFRPNPTPLCNYCDYLDHCDAGQEYTGNYSGKNFGETNW